MVAVTKAVSRYRWVVLGLVFLCEWGSAMAIQSIGPLAPLFQPELGLTKSEVGFFSSATFAGAWGVLLIAGYLNDRLGLRAMLSLGGILTGSLMISMAMVGSFVQAVAVMFVAGLGRGLGAPGTTKAIVEWFQPTSRATAVGVKQAGMPAAGIVAASTLPAFALIWGWRYAIALAGFLILLGGVLTALLYRDARKPGQDLRRKPSMRADVGVVTRNRYLWRLSIIALLLVTSQFALVGYLALYLAEIVLVPLVPDPSARIVAAGGYLALCQTGGILGRVFWGALSDRLLKARRLVALAIIAALSTLLCLALGYLGSGSPLWLLTAIVFGLGVTLISWAGLYQLLITETVGHRHAATAVGFSMTVSQFGKVGGPPLFGFLVDLTGSYQAGWLFLACLAAGGALMAILTAGRERHVAWEQT